MDMSIQEDLLSSSKGTHIPLVAATPSSCRRRRARRGRPDVIVVMPAAGVASAISGNLCGGAQACTIRSTNRLCLGVRSVVNAAEAAVCEVGLAPHIAATHSSPVGVVGDGNIRAAAHLVARRSRREGGATTGQVARRAAV